YDFFTYYFTLFLTPMIFLSGVYYPVSQLPAWLATVSNYLPMTCAVQLARPLVLGRTPDDLWGNLLLLTVYGLAALWLALTLTKRRFAA
ncbi:MAG: ABC transporter permease, partial [Quisquiliibacterium sp.]